MTRAHFSSSLALWLALCILYAVGGGRMIRIARTTPLVASVARVGQVAEAAHLYRGHEAYRLTAGRSTTLNVRQSSQIESDTQQLQYLLGNFSQSLNAWFATFSRDTGQTSSTASGPSLGLDPATASTSSSEALQSTSTSSSSSSPSTPLPSSASRSAGSQLAVYFGQTPGTTPESLLPLCQNPDISIIILAFLDSDNAFGGYPSINLGGACWPPDPNSAAYKANAQGLLNCTDIGAQIQRCQHEYQKKMLLSIGGAVSSIIFSNTTSARSFADTAWSLFGAGQSLSQDLRPFGPDVVVDGFDIDNENGRTKYWGDFAQQLRTHYTAEQRKSGKKFYLSAAPQCPILDASIPLSLMHMADFVWVQFYNNPGCNLNSGSGFLESVEAWSKQLNGTGSSGAKTQLFIGAGAWPGAGTGYLGPDKLRSAVQGAKERIVQAGNNFGGVMLWDGLVGTQNGYVSGAAKALQ